MFSHPAGDAENAGVEKERQRVDSRKKRKVGPIRYQRLEAIEIVTAKIQSPSRSSSLHADRTSKQYLDQYMFFCDKNAFESMASFCWMPWMVSNNYGEKVKYDEKQQTNNQRLSIHQTRFILCSLYYCSVSCSISHMPYLAICHYAKQRQLILYSINCDKIQTLFGQTCENISMK